jgi:hypothetical protein
MSLPYILAVSFGGTVSGRTGCIWGGEVKEEVKAILSVKRYLTMYANGVW